MDDRFDSAAANEPLAPSENALPELEADEPQAPSGRLSLDPAKPLVEALLAAFEEVLGYAVSVASTVDDDPKTAVHEYRKSLRRARSVLRMLRPALYDDTWRSLRDRLRDLARPTSLLRDADVLVETCDNLPLTGAAAAALAPLRDEIAAHRDALHAESRAAKVLGTGLRELPSLGDELSRGLRTNTEPHVYVSSFERTYERALKARRKALQRGTDEAIHRWRKRVKEVRYQLELLTEAESGPVDGLRRVYAALAKRLGEITDVIALRHYLRAHADSLSAETAELLDAALADIIAAEVALAADPLVEVRGQVLDRATVTSE